VTCVVVVDLVTCVVVVDLVTCVVVVDLVTKAIVESHVRTCRCSSDELDRLRHDPLSSPQQKLYQNMVRRHDNTCSVV